MKLPKIDKLCARSEFSGLFAPAVTDAAKKVVAALRESGREASEEEVAKLVKNEYFKFENAAPKPVINATGIVVHTNLGRSPISSEIWRKVEPLVSGYSNLEYDLQKGTRGDRYAFVSQLMNMFFGCEDAIVVNNNAAAVFLVLNTLAKGREVVVSRGELVEIGGSFRLPEVMANSGAILREVGATNKTRASDYADAVGENTAMFMKAHKSNYDIVGFSAEVSAGELAKVARDSNLISYYDLGSAYIGTLPFGLSKDEPNLANVIKSGADVISFSGDKLFGGPQCGIIVGRADLIAKLRKNQLLRMLRVDKITLALLAETIMAYMDKNYALIKGFNQIHAPLEALEKNAQKVISNLNSSNLKFEIVCSRTYVGGGTLPNKSYPTVAIAFSGEAQKLERKFRQKGVVGRIEDGRFLLDFRSIFPEHIAPLTKIIEEISNE